MKSETFRIYALARRSRGVMDWVEAEATRVRVFCADLANVFVRWGLEALGEVVSCQEVGEVSAWETTLNPGSELHAECGACLDAFAPKTNAVERPPAKVARTPKAPPKVAKTARPDAPKVSSVRKPAKEVKRPGHIDDFDSGSVYCHQGASSNKTTKFANKLAGLLLAQADMLKALTNVRFWEQSGH